MNKITTRVYFSDTDAVGVVYHANYLDFAERARTEASRMCGIDIVELAKKGEFFVVRTANIDYISPAKLDDLLQIEVSIPKFGKTSMEVVHKITNSETKKEICNVTCLLVFVVNKNGVIKPAEIPENVKTSFKLLSL